jgi:hypothetical protein
MSILTTQKIQSLNFESKTTSSTTRRPKAEKSSKRSSRRRKAHKTNKWQEKRQTKEKAKKSSNSKLSLSLSMQALSLLGRIYHVSSLNHPISKRVLSTLCTFSEKPSDQFLGLIVMSH